MDSYKNAIIKYLIAKHLEGRKTIKANELNELLGFDYSGDNALFLSYKIREDINRTLQQLQEDNLVVLKIVKNPSILIYNLVLVPDSIDRLCESAGFVPKEKAENAVRNALSQARYTKINQYVDTLRQNPFSAHSIFQYKNGKISDMDIKDGLDALKAAEYIMSKDITDVQMVRNVSKQLFNNSKRFQNIENKILTVLNNVVDDETKESVQGKKIYEYFGVVNNPFFIEFRGKFTLRQNTYNNEWFALNSLNKELLEQITNIKGNIITIENRTTYFDYQKNKDDLVVYTGGFLSPVLTKFLHDIAVKYPDKSFYHWSDIDGGGFYIFSYLHKHVTESYRPINMDIKALTDYKEFCEPLTAEDRKRISRFLSDPFFSKTAQYMLDNNVKLEQEAFYANR